MSSTNRGGRRRAGDTYYTPDAVAQACVAKLPFLDGRVVLEPSAGGGAFLRAVAAVSPTATPHGVDIDSFAPAGDQFDVLCEDFLDYRIPKHGVGPDWIIGNPPFSEAEAHVRHALGMARLGVGMLLRLAFLESTKRRPFWAEHPPTEVYVLSRRPSFTGGGTDSAAYGWFIWLVGLDAQDVQPRLGWLEWSP